MPNHVYNIISVEEKYADKLEEISKVGLCKYYAPMPKEIEKTSSPPTVVSEEEYKKEPVVNNGSFKSYRTTKKKVKNLIKKYGASNWYDWANKVWGTKWGCYDNECHDGIYSFTSAWSPPSEKIIRKLSEDIPTFTFEWEEEQGYGAVWQSINGVLMNMEEYDLPVWGKSVDTGSGTLVYLVEDYHKLGDKYKKGWYMDWSIEEFVSTTKKEALKEVERMQA